LEALYLTALTTAMRRGEILGLRWPDIDLDTRKLAVNQSLQRAAGTLQLLPLKTKSSTRTIHLPGILIAALRRHGVRQKEEKLAAGPDWQGNPGRLVFTSRRGTPLEPRNVVRSFKIALVKAGLPETKFHNLRHTAATLLFENHAHPKQVQALLGHSRISTTLDTYTHVTEQMLDDTAERIDSIFAPVRSAAQSRD
jgi:integrase